MTNGPLTKSLMIGGLTALLGVQGLTAAQINNCADWNPCCFDYGLNPPPTCPTCCGCTWYGEIEYLYWKPFVENAQPCYLATADKLPSNLSESFTARTTTRPKDFHYDWDSGFRVALGYGFPCDKWGLALTWTHYRTDANFAENGSATVTQNGITDLKIPLPGFVVGTSTASLQTLGHHSLTSKWDFQFNQIDLDFFRDYYVGCSLSLKPYVGLRALILNNTIKTLSEYDDAAPALLQANFTQSLRSNFKSFGLKGGLESFWEVMCGLGVYGNVGASIVYANYDVTNKTNIVDLLSNSLNRQTQEIETPYKFQSLKMMSDLAIGVQWREPINCNQNLIVIKAGWEHHMILQGSQFQTLLTSQAAGGILPPYPFTFAGDISLYGFVFSLGLSF